MEVSSGYHGGIMEYIISICNIIKRRTSNRMIDNPKINKSTCKT